MLPVLARAAGALFLVCYLSEHDLSNGALSRGMLDLAWLGNSAVRLGAWRRVFLSLVLVPFGREVAPRSEHQRTDPRHLILVHFFSGRNGTRLRSSRLPRFSTSTRRRGTPSTRSPRMKRNSWMTPKTGTSRPRQQQQELRPPSPNTRIWGDVHRRHRHGAR